MGYILTISATGQRRQEKGETSRGGR